MLIKIPLIQCFDGIHFMRQTIKEVGANTAYRWFLGLSLACLNIKKLVKLMTRRPFDFGRVQFYYPFFDFKSMRNQKRQTSFWRFVFNLNDVSIFPTSFFLMVLIYFVRAFEEHGISKTKETVLFIDGMFVGL